jgi:nitroimidazol reductase NimA-like FMN-containing flavoprotein (pyridoxamine 5'-phosphate oxidase superfamily)
LRGAAAAPTVRTDVCGDARQLVELGREQCLRLLAGGSAGRIAVNEAGWPPLIRPVFYLFDEPSQSIIFRSAEGSKLTSLLRSERVAFEIDGFDAVARAGWSVIVIGPVEEITSAEELERLRDAPPGTWVGAAHVMRIRATVVTGRRLERAAGA